MFSPRDDLSRRWGSSGGRSGGRGQSELVAVTLLLLVVILGSIVVTITSVGAINENKRTVAVSQAETSLQQLDSRSSDVILGFDNETSQVVDLRHGGGSEPFVTERKAWMRVEIQDTETGNAVENGTVVNQTMGSVVYRRDDTTLALEGGGVWRSDNGGAVMISPPEFHFRDGTLTLPIVDVSGESSLGGQVRVTRKRVVRNGNVVPNPERRFPNETANLTNRLRDGKVVVTVHSDYYRAWGQYFEDTSNAYVWYDHDKQQVNVVYLVLPGWGSLRSGIIATSGAGELSLVGQGAYVDSYNSTVGPYNVTKSSDGIVEAVGDVTLGSSAATIEGDVRSGGFVNVDNPGATIDGDVSWTDGFNNDGTVTGVNVSIDGIASVEPIDGFVELSVDIIEANNDNLATGGVIQNDRLDIAPGGSAELGAGAYYLDDLTLEGQKLVLNTSDGDIHIAVRDWMLLEKKGGLGSNMTVKGDGVVRIYLLSDATTQVSITGLGNQDVNLHVGTESRVTVRGDHSPQLRLFAPEEFAGTIAGSNNDPADFTGVIYAPAGNVGPSSVYVKHGNAYGQIVTGNLTLGQGGAAHYDRALRGVALPRSPTLARLEFMHVAAHRVEVRERD